MKRAFSVASWNVQHFKNEAKRIDNVISFLCDQHPDVIALYEVIGKDVFWEVSRRMSRYTFHVTEGPQTQEILLGVRANLTAFFTQKLEFRSGVTVLRPGALLTITHCGVDYTLLFLHTKSGTDPRGMGLRDDMLMRACRFRRRLDRLYGGRANYIFLGDLNTMGMRYPYRRSIDADVELRKLDNAARRARMRRLSKTQGATWMASLRSRMQSADLDHVVASDHLVFRRFADKDVDVRGWPSCRSRATRNAWRSAYSDHALLYFELQRATSLTGSAMRML